MDVGGMGGATRQSGRDIFQKAVGSTGVSAGVSGGGRSGDSRAIFGNKHILN